jgi:hypothetical protein
MNEGQHKSIEQRQKTGNDTVKKTTTIQRRRVKQKAHAWHLPNQWNMYDILLNKYEIYTKHTTTYWKSTNTL